MLVHDIGKGGVSLIETQDDYGRAVIFQGIFLSQCGQIMRSGNSAVAPTNCVPHFYRMGPM